MRNKLLGSWGFRERKKKRQKKWNRIKKFCKRVHSWIPPSSFQGHLQKSAVTGQPELVADFWDTIRRFCVTVPVFIASLSLTVGALIITYFLKDKIEHRTSEDSTLVIIPQVSCTILRNLRNGFSLSFSPFSTWADYSAKFLTTVFFVDGWKRRSLSLSSVYYLLDHMSRFLKCVQGSQVSLIKCLFFFWPARFCSPLSWLDWMLSIESYPTNLRHTVRLCALQKAQFGNYSASDGVSIDKLGLHSGWTFLVSLPCTHWSCTCFAFLYVWYRISDYDQPNTVRLCVHVL